MRVLVVEDDPGLGPLIVDGLRSAGFAVDLAERLTEADFKASVNTYDCVVADRGLPDGDALELLKRWRRSGHTVDDYVDWTGVDGYNWGTSAAGFTWQSFNDVFAGIYPQLAAKGKPIIIGEMASDEVGGSKAQWIDDIVPTLKNNYPQIKAFVWFDVDKERHWQTNSSPESLAAYQRMTQDPYLNP